MVTSMHNATNFDTDLIIIYAYDLSQIFGNSHALDNTEISVSVT